jgi:hypothetical protein
MAMEESRKVLYINLMVTDQSVAVHRAVQRRINEKDLPTPLHNVASKVGQRVAKHVVESHPEVGTKIMSEKLPLELVKKLKKRGIVGVAETVFVEAPSYIVIQLQVQHVETHRLVEAKSRDFHDDETGELESRATLSPCLAIYITQFFDFFWRLLGSRRERVQSAFEDDHLPRIVQAKLQTLIPELLAEKLHRKGLEMDMQVLPEEQQSRFFYTQLHAMRTNAAAAATSNKDSTPTRPLLLPGFVRNQNEGLESEKRKSNTNKMIVSFCALYIIFMHCIIVWSILVRMDIP